jgi:hypothetical protein
MQPERAELYFQQGSSDKVYHLQLEARKTSGLSKLSGGGAVPPCRAM